LFALGISTRSAWGDFGCDDELWESESNQSPLLSLKKSCFAAFDDLNN
jgi:hypothetical protein